ncbi:putative colanic acid biosysnthesis UDP-glucose lipid carrier transferase [Fodinibius roseus]|uniref:Putative colanic acid biosysnthesis UDP-glucose lipid carrier transferase n=2 Tax=Fodinibius roseus TaxID=1194090 RepID=A0A1M4TFQ8_9BACT|nr:putative colanic acid biosysnthesis UDP-glucose lipid carrier transferase [Fodinibius roseus]
MSTTAQKHISGNRKVRMRSVSLPTSESALNLEINSISIDYARIYHEKLIWKQALDLLSGMVGTFILMVLYPFIALGIKLSSNGPVIFKQERSGYDGRVFNCYKFRTMHCNKDEKSVKNPDITQKNDSRIFAFGRFLRKTNLDEIPQFINVLKGDMSLVGPRPYPIRENSYWNTMFPDFYKRFSVKPGLTGLAQASGLRGGTLNIEDMRERLKCDLKYINKRSFVMDVKLIFLTIKSMLTLNTHAH